MWCEILAIVYKNFLYPLLLVWFFKAIIAGAIKDQVDPPPRAPILLTLDSRMIATPLRGGLFVPRRTNMSVRRGILLEALAYIVCIRERYLFFCSVYIYKGFRFFFEVKVDVEREP